jgi:hypothetical protein
MAVYVKRTCGRYGTALEAWGRAYLGLGQPCESAPSNRGLDLTRFACQLPEPLGLHLAPRLGPVARVKPKSLGGPRGDTVTRP